MLSELRNDAPLDVDDTELQNPDHVHGFVYSIAQINERLRELGIGQESEEGQAEEVPLSLFGM